MVLFYLDLCSKNPHTPFIRKRLRFPELSRAELSRWRQADLRCWAALYRSVLTGRLICHLCRSFVRAVWRVWCALTWGCGGRGALCSSITAPSHMSAHRLLSLPASPSLPSPYLSVSPSLSPTTKCSPARGTWWLWRVHMKTCQWRYEVLRSVWLFGSLQFCGLLLW